MKRRVLFLCTGNSARSVLPEATLRAWAGHRFEVFSAGSQPAGTVNPYALGQLAADSIDTARMPSKYTDAFATTEMAPMKLVGAVRHQDAAQACPSGNG